MYLGRTEVFAVVMLTVAGVLMDDSDSEDSDAEIHPKGSVYVESSDFSKVAATSAFVDKTLFIREFFKAPNLVLITTPGKFGASTNMDMLRRFVQIPFAEDVGAKTSTTTEESLVLDVNSEETENIDPFEKYQLKICAGKRFCDRYKGKYPVIHVDFKRIQGITFDTVLENFKTVMFKIFNTHKYLLESDQLDDVKKTIIRKYFNLENNSTLFESEVVRSLQFLSKYLRLHHNKDVIVLWDDYDAPVREAMNYNSSDTPRIVDFLQRLTTHVLKDNSFVERALLNARSTLLARILCTNLTIKHYPFLYAHGFAEFYGFTEFEVRNLVERFNVSERFVDAKSWYSGYKNRMDGLKVFNVLSIVRFLETERIESYWILSGGTVPRMIDVVLVPAVRTKLMSLIRGRRIVIDKVTLDVDELVRYQHFLYSPLKYVPEGMNYVDLFLQFLLDYGYLHVMEEDAATLTLSIPNAEVGHQLLQSMHSSVVNSARVKFDPVEAKPVMKGLELLRKRYHNITY